MSSKYDVVVGIPSYNESATIDYVVRTVGKGLAKYFPDTKNVIVNCDNNSPDNTKGVFLSAEVPFTIDKKYISTSEGVKGKGNNFWNLFNFCSDVNAKIAIVVDADLRSITPEWIKHLGYPIKDGYDFTAPYYSRHQFDGTITNHLCYPLMYSLGNLNIRQPIGGEFAFSQNLCSFWLNRQWNDMTRNFGIDIFMSLGASFGNFKICETGLGTKIHNPSAPKLGRMFEEVVFTLFTTLLEHKDKWLGEWLKKGDKTKWQPDVANVPRFGLETMSEPEFVHIDIVKLKHDCREEFRKYHDLVKWYLSPYAHDKVYSMVEMDHFEVDIMLWSQIVYSLFYLFDGASKQTKMDIINVLKPLYFARSISFDYQTFRYSTKFAESEVKNQAKAFLSQKPYLLGLYVGEGKHEGT